MDDSVRETPGYYDLGGYEVLDVIRDSLTSEEYQGFCWGNVIKYVLRWRYKGGAADLVKARDYINAMLDQIDSEKVCGAACDTQGNHTGIYRELRPNGFSGDCGGYE